MNLLDLKIQLEKDLGYTFTINKDLTKGLLSTNQAFLNAKKEGKNPSILATELSKGIIDYLNSKNLSYFTVSTSGPYINLILNNEAYLSLSQSLCSLPQNNERVFLEYVSPNVAKELHLGHMRNMNIGEAIRRLLKINHPNLITDNHWGDWGVQFGILIWAYKKFIIEGVTSTVTINDEVLAINTDVYNSNKLQALVRMYVWSTQNKDQYPNFDSEVRSEFLALEAKDPTNTALWKEFIATSIVEVSNDMELFNVPKHDIEQGESYYEPSLGPLYTWFEDNKLWSVEGKARYINFEQLSLLTNDQSIKSLGYGYLVSSTGYSTYLFRDIAARLDWVNNHNAQQLITVTGNEQLHHFKQLFAVCNYISSLDETKEISTSPLSLSKSNLKHISYGFLTLAGGQKMSTRKGIIYTARGLYNEIYAKAKLSLESRNIDTTEDSARAITLAAIKWQDLGKDTTGDIEFDINSMLNFEGNTGVYQLYTIARIHSILDKLDNTSQIDINTLTEPEKLIFSTILLEPSILNDTVSKLKPHILVNYNYELTNLFNSWYNTTSLIKESDTIRQATLIHLLKLIVQVLEYNLDKLGILTVKKL